MIEKKNLDRKDREQTALEKQRRDSHPTSPQEPRGEEEKATKHLKRWEEKHSQPRIPHPVKFILRSEGRKDVLGIHETIPGRTAR